MLIYSKKITADVTDASRKLGCRAVPEGGTDPGQVHGNPNIAGVSNYFGENDTSYFVMDYTEGISFKTRIANQGGRVSVEDALNAMLPVLRALTAVHWEGFIHRDVTPDNIYIENLGSQNGTMVNGVRMQMPTILGNGDTITVETAAFRLKI